MTRYSNVAAYILAGGKSSRMGEDKSLLEFDGVPQIVRSVELVRPFVNSVTIVVSRPRYAALGFREIKDQFSGFGGTGSVGAGPLAGIAAALSDSDSSWNLILACDLPHLSEPWVDRMLRRAMSSADQVVLPRTDRGVQPLAAVYHSSCREHIRAVLASGMRKVTEAVSGLRADVVDESEWQDIDSPGLVLTNMNTPEDYREALRAREKTEHDGERIKKR
jgi:molybdopterin-guanine dinucleotide biosynthesis protein A